jgi:hypothetical protein
MTTVSKITLGVILAVVVIVLVVAAGHVSHQQEASDQQQTEFCKKLQKQGADAEMLIHAGCKP